MLKIVGRLSVEYCHHIHYDLSSAILTGGYVKGETMNFDYSEKVQGIWRR
ncbi:hypothetical protein [Neobacillus cucumis]|nr:hypothetical protein [Neobacillus cucumis]MBM7652938.1 hypothetical protein [Neobacillus cucumis]